MASFITTMFVCAPFPNTPPAPLAPVFSLAPSASCVTFHAQSVSSPGAASTLLRAPENGGDEGPSLPQGFLSNARTRSQFKPRNANKGTSSYQLRQFAEATLGNGSLRKAVKLPEGEDLNEWLAVNGRHERLRSWEETIPAETLLIYESHLVVDFYNQINLLYGSITEFCSPQSCPEMKATEE